MMETGRKFWIAVLAVVSINGLALFAMLKGVALPDAAIAAIATVAGFFMGANAASTFAHAGTSTTADETRREIAQRRAVTDDGTEDTP